MEFGKGRFQFNKDSYPLEKAFVRELSFAHSHLGLPQWGINEWKGRLYTQEAKSSDFLSQYSQRLECVEVSSTFYAEVGEKTLLNWKSQVPKHFRFIPKWPKFITHEHFLSHSGKGLAPAIKDFISRMELLEENLGVTMLQLPPTFSVEYKANLHQFLQQVPKGFPLAIEFRNASWLQGPRLYSRLEEYFIKNNISTVCTDTPAKREVFHLSFTGGKNIIRYVSDDVVETDAKRLQIWKEWLEGLNSGGDFYFIIHKEDNEHAPDLIAYFAPEKSQAINEQVNTGQMDLLDSQ